MTDRDWTAEVRNDYVVSGRSTGEPLYGRRERRKEFFDRWLAERDTALVENTVKTMLSLAETFTHEGVEIWLRNPNKLMGDQRPIDLLYAGDEKPHQIAEGLADGVFF